MSGEELLSYWQEMRILKYLLLQEILHPRNYRHGLKKIIASGWI